MAANAHEASTAELVRSLDRLDRERLQGYREYLDFYAGRQWLSSERFAGRRERRLTLNYARSIVDKTTSYLMSSLDFAVDPVDSSAEARDRARRTEEVLYQVYADNQLALLDFDTEIDAAILGDGAYKVTWDSAAGRVRISAPDVQDLFVWTAGDDLTRVRRVASRYRLTGEEAAEHPDLRDFAGASLVSVVEVWTEAAFDLWASPDNGEPVLVRSEANPYGLIPFVIFPNLRRPKQFWGESDIPAIREVCRELNRAISNLSTIMELSGNPIAVLENVDSSEDIQIAPGAVWELPERARAYLLDLLAGGGVRVHIDYLDALYRAIHDLGESPRTAFGDNQRNLSGVALEVELQPLLQKVKRKRLIRTAVYERRNELILRLLERFTGEPFAPYRSRIIWGSPTPRDRSREILDEQRLVAIGIHSRRRAAGNLGVENPEAEFGRWLEEQRAMQALGRAGAAPSIPIE